MRVVCLPHLHTVAPVHLDVAGIIHPWDTATTRDARQENNNTPQQHKKVSARRTDEHTPAPIHHQQAVSAHSPEHELALGLTEALQDSAVLGVLGQHGLEGQQHLLNRLHELGLLGVSRTHLVEHTLWVVGLRAVVVGGEEQKEAEHEEEKSGDPGQKT